MTVYKIKSKGELNNLNLKAGDIIEYDGDITDFNAFPQQEHNEILDKHINKFFLMYIRSLKGRLIFKELIQQALKSAVEKERERIKNDVKTKLHTYYGNPKEKEMVYLDELLSHLTKE